MLVSELEKKAEQKIKKQRIAKSRLIDASSKVVNPLLLRSGYCLIHGGRCQYQ